MSTLDPIEEQRSVKLRQRLWGAAVLIALAVIFLPYMLDGSGSESQYRRVERLREEPPRVIDAQGRAEPTQKITSQQPRKADLIHDSAATVPLKDTSEALLTTDRENVQQRSGTAAREAVTDNSGISAWVVQAGSFGDEANALAVRDRLRRAGFPSFVAVSNDGRLHRVQVGPMINQGQAEATLSKVTSLLQRDAIVVRYP